MSWLKYIQVSCLLLVVLTVLGFPTEAGKPHSVKGSFHQQQVSTQHLPHSFCDYLWINAPLPERPEELLFIEESEDKQQYWILEVANQQSSTCVSSRFGQPDYGFELQAEPFTRNFPITQLSCRERLNFLQIFRI